MQAVLYGARDAIVRLSVESCQEVADFAWNGPSSNLELIVPASQIHRSLIGEVNSDIAALITTVGSRLDVFSSSVILAIVVASLYSIAYAYLTASRANHKISPGSYGYDRFYQAIIRSSKLPITILGQSMGYPTSFCGGAEILQECLTGSNAAEVARALDALLRSGIGFEVVSRGRADREIVMRGTPVGRSCAIYFSVVKAKDGSAGLDILDAIPIPVWVRKVDRSIGWANKAFLSIRDEQETIENWEGGLATEGFNKPYPVTGRRSIVAGDENLHFQMNMAALSADSLVGVATGVGDIHSLEKKLQLTAELFASIIEHIPFPMAIFDSHQKLALYNKKYPALWGLSEHWLQAGPSKGEIIDRLRDQRKLPEQKDFQRWKRSQLRVSADMRMTELWHLPGGKSLRIMTGSIGAGGQIMIFEDISSRLLLEASLNRLSQMQKAVIDALDDAVAIFGPDGRLALHNSRFEELWHFTPSELSKRPHCIDIARICDARMGCYDIWNVISSSISAVAAASTNVIHEIRRENGYLISLTLSRLPDGMTMAVFSDFTDLGRFEAMLEEDRSTGQDLNRRSPKTG